MAVVPITLCLPPRSQPLSRIQGPCYDSAFPQWLQILGSRKTISSLVWPIQGLQLITESLHLTLGLLHSPITGVTNKSTASQIPRWFLFPNAHCLFFNLMNGSPAGKGFPAATPAIPGWLGCPGWGGGKQKSAPFAASRAICSTLSQITCSLGARLPGQVGTHTRQTPHRGEIKENAQALSPPDDSVSSYSIALFTPACRRHSSPRA